jgi:hypothetical protein
MVLNPSKALNPVSASLGRSYLETDMCGRKPTELVRGFVFPEPAQI